MTRTGRFVGERIVRDSASAEVAYDDLGSGEVVVLLHGFAGTAHAHFDPLIEALTPTYRIIAPDLRGYGRSARLARMPDTEMFRRDARDVQAILDDIAAPFAHIVGFSDGAEAGIILASQLGTRARSLTVWGVSGRIPPPEVVSLYAEPETRIPNWPRLRDRLDELHGQGRAVGIVSAWAGAMSEFAQHGGDINGREAASVTCPTLVLASDSDPYNPLERTQELVARIPTARLIVLPQAGHDLLHERGPQVIALIKRMLASSQA